MGGRSVAVYLSGNPVHDRVLRAFFEGAPEPKILCTFPEYEPTDIAVVFGVYKRNIPVSYARGEIMNNQLAIGNDTLVLETGYVNRGDGEENHYAAGLNGLNGHADFRNEGMPSDRWDMLEAELQPWKPPGKNVILCGQVPWDASVQDVDMHEWLKRKAKEIAEVCDHPIIYRPHPCARNHPQEVPGCVTTHDFFHNDLANAWCVVTYNSNAAVDAIIEGVPAIATGEGSMARGIALMDVGQILWAANVGQCDRQQWANDLAYTQWTPAEMRAGHTWRHLFK